MKKSKLLLWIALILAAAVILGGPFAIADFGDFGGSSDYGGSDWGSSDWGSSDWGSSYDSDGSYSGGMSGLGVFILIALIVALYFVGSIAGKKKSRRPAGATTVAASKLRTIAEYHQRDPRFSEPQMQGKISNLYVQMQNCWTAKNLDSLRPYFTDTAYAQFDRQLESYRQNRRTNYVERIAVLSVELRGWYEEEKNDCMVATVRTRIVDYTGDDQTGKIISGSNTAEKFMTYEYIMIRSSGYVTGAQDRAVDAFNCPNCSAPLNINYSAQCPYCDSIITTKDYDWVISSIKGVSQVTR